MTDTFSPAYVVWESTDGPSLHGPFANSPAARDWAYADMLAYGHIEEDEFPDAKTWYDQDPQVWVLPCLPVET